MSSLITKIVGWIGLVPESPEPPGLLPDEKPKQPPGANKYGQYTRLVESLRSALERFAIGELQGHRGINPNLRCRVSLIEIRPTNEDTSVVLRAFLGIHSPATIAEFIERDILASLTNGRHFDFSEFGGLALIGRDNTNESESARDPLLAEFGPSNTHTLDYDITVNWEPVDGRDKVENADEPMQDEWILHVGKEASSRKLPRQSAKTLLTIGKSEECDIVVNIVLVSAIHGKLWFDKDQWWYADNTSTNGSFIQRPNQPEVVFPRKGETIKSRPSKVSIPPGGRIYLQAFVADETPYLELKPALQLPIDFTPVNLPPS